MSIMTDEDVFASSLPITEDQISACAWAAIGTGSFGLITAYIQESTDYLGYFCCRVIAVDGCSETKRPVLAKAVGIQMDSLLEHHGAKSSDLKWREDVAPTSATRKKGCCRSGEIVYFLKAGDFIKIGKATGSADSRVSSLQTGCPFPIEILAEIPGGLAREARLHRVFAGLHAHGEWFHAAPSLLRFIDRLSARQGGAV